MSKTETWMSVTAVVVSLVALGVTSVQTCTMREQVDVERRGQLTQQIFYYFEIIYERAECEGGGERVSRDAGVPANSNTQAAANTECDIGSDPTNCTKQCLPVHELRVRQEAALALLTLVSQDRVAQLRSYEWDLSLGHARLPWLYVVGTFPKVSFAQADLRCADFRNAWFETLSLQSADLRGAWLSEGVAGEIVWTNAICPDGNRAGNDEGAKCNLTRMTTESACNVRRPIEPPRAIASTSATVDAGILAPAPTDVSRPSPIWPGRAGK